MKIPTTCDFCGVAFARYPSRAHTTLAFCSLQCHLRSYECPRVAAIKNAQRAARVVERRAAMPPLYQSPLDDDGVDWSDAFWSKVAPEALSGCWLWMGAVDGKGYGATLIRGRQIGAHRHALQLKLARRLASDELACHRCDVPLCVRPEHLFPGSASDNQQDCIAKGRKSSRVGEDAPNAKRTAEVVLAIRAAFAAGESQRSIARRFGIGFRQVHALVHRYTWTHLEAA